MTQGIYALFSDNKPLPAGTRIKTTQGGRGWHTGDTHELSADSLERANKIVNGYFPFWIHGWRDLHDDLFAPGEAPEVLKQSTIYQHTIA